MPKKKGGKGKKGKKKGKGKKKKKQKVEDEKPKGPTEKELFQMKIKQLTEWLELADADLVRQNEMLENVRTLLMTEVSTGQSSVHHMMRELRKESCRRLQVQEKLQTERDLAELMDTRAQAKVAASDRGRDAAKSFFQQQKAELERRLSLLEDIRLAKVSQRHTLKKVEDALEEKVGTHEGKCRSEDSHKVDTLLSNRQTFLAKCREIREEWRDVFRLRMPVHAKGQLEKNVYLRDLYDKKTKHLLQVQEQNRALKTLQKSLDLEHEIQSSAEDGANRRRALQEDRLLRAHEKLLLQQQSSSDVRLDPGQMIPDPKSPAEILEDRARLLEPIPERYHRGREEAEEDIARKVEAIRRRQIERCRLLDKESNLEDILGDQEDLAESMKRRIEESVDRNGVLMSAVQRAGKIFQTRCGKTAESRAEEGLDFDVLQQIHRLLEMASEEWKLC